MIRMRFGNGVGYTFVIAVAGFAVGAVAMFPLPPDPRSGSRIV